MFKPQPAATRLSLSLSRVSRMSLRLSARTEVRRNRYKVAVDAEEGRRRREDNMVEIRKNRREESLMKKRRQALQPTNHFPVQLTSLEKKVPNSLIVTAFGLG